MSDVPSVIEHESEADDQMLRTGKESNEIWIKNEKRLIPSLESHDVLTTEESGH